jgi:hypothetical protein
MAELRAKTTTISPTSAALIEIVRLLARQSAQEWIAAPPDDDDAAPPRPGLEKRP